MNTRILVSYLCSWDLFIFLCAPLRLLTYIPINLFCTEKSFGRHEAFVWFELKTTSGGIHTADYNCFLFPDDQVEAILCALDYIEICNIMSGLAKMFVNTDAGAIIILHRPWGIGIDSRNHVSIEDSILRLLLAEIIRGVVLKTTRVPAIGLVPTVEEEDDPEHGVNPHAAVIAAYFIEVARRGNHVDKRISSACARDAITDHGVLACRQNNLPRHSAHPDYPTGEVGRNVWREEHNGQRIRETDRQNNNTVIWRLRSILSFLESKVHAESESLVLMTVEEFLREDDRTDGTYRYRRSSLLRSFPVGSRTHDFLANHWNATRHNAGNTDATGHTTEELSEYDGDFQRLIRLQESKQVFLIRENNASSQSPSQAVLACAKERGWAVLTVLTRDGARNKLQAHESTPNGTLANGKVRAIHQWNPNYPTKATRGNGKKVDGYVACIMDDKDKM